MSGISDKTEGIVILDDVYDRICQYEELTSHILRHEKASDTGMTY